jgi:ATP-dependent RNA helicase RhlE
MSFEQLNLIKPIQKALDEEGYTIPTPIQQQSIPIILERKDILGCAQTGTGKTAAYAVPILQILHEEKSAGKEKKNISSLVLAPTRELALQISESFTAYSKYVGLRNVVIYGGIPQKRQTDKLKKGCDILIATPGRLLDLMNQKYIDLKHVKILVLDEADRMLDMGFIPDIKKIVATIPEKRQTLFFSATMPSSIVKLAGSILNHPVKVEISPEKPMVEAITQGVYFVSKQKKKDLLLHLLQDSTISSALVFTRTKHGADKVEQFLNNAKIRADAIHGNKSQGARQRALNNFKAKKTRVLVATDIAARGIDVEELSHVINYEMPDQSENYIHRIGRTGRAGLSGVAISFCDSEEKMYLRDINRLIPSPIPVMEDNPFPSNEKDEEKAPKSTGRSRSSRGPRSSGDRRPSSNRNSSSRRGSSERHGSSDRRHSSEGHGHSERRNSSEEHSATESHSSSEGHSSSEKRLSSDGHGFSEKRNSSEKRGSSEKRFSSGDAKKNNKSWFGKKRNNKSKGGSGSQSKSKSAEGAVRPQL